MDSTTDDRARQEISLLESLDGEWLKLPLAVMQEAGPAVQTLAGLLKMTNKETYVPVGDIARRARLPIGTVRKHLVALDAGGWITNHGRQHTRRGRPRRTCTITLTKRTKDKIEPYAILPWWACCNVRKVGKLPWCARAVLSTVMARLMTLKAAAERGGDQDGDDELMGAIDNMGGANRFRFSLDWLVRQTGMTKESVVTGKRLLHHHFGIVRWRGNPIQRGVNTETDMLLPNMRFRVVVTPAPGGGCYLAFDRGSESGQ